MNFEINSKRLTLYAFLLIFALFILSQIFAFEFRGSEPYPFTELAMLPGMKIEAKNKNGEFGIEWLGPLKRKYNWNGKTATRTLIPRKERFMGRLGAYDPASASFITVMFRTRIVADDSVLNFSTMKEIEAKLYESSAVYDWVYTDDGLVLGFSESPDRHQVNIDVYQFLLNGKKPNGIKGSRPELIKVSFKDENS
jgi:hypothetical protein